MYNKLPIFFSIVNFPAVPDFYKKNRIARVGKFFEPEKNSGFFLFAWKKPGLKKDCRQYMK